MEHRNALIQPSTDHAQQLRNLVLTAAELRRAGYVLKQFSPSELDRKKRCERCNRATSPPEAERALNSLFDHLSVSLTKNNAGKLAEPITRCKFHPGQVINKKWTCCGNHSAAKPCVGEEQHSPLQYAAGELEDNWTFYPTPAVAPKSNPPLAIVIDCEMGNAESDDSELIRVSMVDFYSRRVLLDSLVFPSVKMAHYNPRYSGVSFQMMQDALRRGRCFCGCDEARAAVCRIVGPETVVIGHAANQDLISLRWIHKIVIDTLLIEQKRRQRQRVIEDATNTVDASSKANHTTHAEDGQDQEGEEDASTPKPDAGYSLKALALEKLDRVIQVSGRGHDSVEDALATRDLLLWYMSHPSE